MKQLVMAVIGLAALSFCAFMALVAVLLFGGEPDPQTGVRYAYGEYNWSNFHKAQQYPQSAIDLIEDEMGSKIDRTTCNMVVAFTVVPPNSRKTHGTLIDPVVENWESIDDDTREDMLRVCVTKYGRSLYEGAYTFSTLY